MGGVEQDRSHAPGRRAVTGLGWARLEQKLIENSWGEDSSYIPGVPRVWKRRTGAWGHRLPLTPDGVDVVGGGWGVGWRSEVKGCSRSQVWNSPPHETISQKERKLKKKKEKRGET